MHSLSAEGVRRWSAPTRDHIVGSAAIGADGDIYVGSYDFG
ncbi:MAG: PQQ-binding-like beta-propeller repeat protein, partial [Dehalococcoidia bacterium]